MENKYYTATILDKLPKECFENNVVHKMLNMIKDNKYYTPSIEEFHVGFEYEYWNNTTDEWCSTVLGNGPISLFFADYLGIDEPDKYRVKYLDKEDIESLGGINLPDTNSFDIGDCQIYFQDHTYVEVYDDCGRLVFQGTVKNKSELKRVLKQIGVL